MPKEFIVAIELGSSKMTGIAGQKNLDGSITVLATVEENSSSCIRKGVIYNISKELREASLSLGATQWQTIKYVVLRKARPGMIAAIVLALSRTLGETIAVLMVCGNLAIVPGSLLDACYPIPALIANNYGEMLSVPLYDSALMFAAFLLFFVVVILNLCSRIVLLKVKR